MTLGELRDMLDHFGASVMGVDSDTEIKIVIQDAGVTAELDDVEVTSRMVARQYTSNETVSVITLQGRET